ncbi:putative endopeptidase Clp [Medicago truncatula]|uniref:ATP-dependent Clp protease proteolytic subunit n=1 Tax=Medicago truncatula TaxID=3880 RepID=G7K6U0_MEDTR|nr:ATP-dependent Clp protease proteolytic subunit 4, chloroplastic [Medicago truncatula]AES95560.1 ATP-dependent Clp protease proteolytic protein [Medicago truncatula]AFK35935.1 unknown [Medicago truncatula]RHN54662.1 putative endopeptidase Clp [Medicago truncatula]
MDFLTTSPSLSRRIPTLFSKPTISSFNSKPHFPLQFSQFRTTPINCVLTTPSPSKNPNFNPQLQKPSITFQLSSPQTPERAIRGAESDTMGLLLRERIVFLGSEIDDFVADAIMSQLLLLDAQDPTKDIKLFINSPGGSLSATMAIYDAVQLVRADVSTIAMGISASTASIILGGGTKGKRLAMPNTRIMIAQPPGGASGQAIDVEIQAKEIMHNKNNVSRIISSFTGRSLEQVLKDIDRDRYLSPIEAVEYGIIDGVIDREMIIPLLPVPEKVEEATLKIDDADFLNPHIPDDEIY